MTIKELKDYADSVDLQGEIGDPGDVINRLLKMIFKLPDESPSPGEAVAFANFTRNRIQGRDDQGNELWELDNGQYGTTEQLHQLFPGKVRKEVGEERPIYPLSAQGLDDMLTDYLHDHLKASGYSTGSEHDYDKLSKEQKLRKDAVIEIIQSGIAPTRVDKKEVIPVFWDTCIHAAIVKAKLGSIVYGLPETDKVINKLEQLKISKNGK